MERQRHFFGGQEAAAVDHRPAEIEQQHCAGLIHLLGAVHLEVGRDEFDGGAGPLPHHRVLQGGAQVEQERIAELVGFGVVAAIAALATMVRFVVAKAIARQVLEDVSQRLLADLADRAWRELELVPAALYQTRLLQHLRDLVQLVQLILGLFAQLTLQHLPVDRRRIGSIDRLAHLTFQTVHLLQVLHHLHGLLKADGVFASERVAPPQVIHRAQLFEIGGQHRQLVAQSGVLHEGLHQLHQLAPLLGAHRVEHALHLRLPLLELLDQLVE